MEEDQDSGADSNESATTDSEKFGHKFGGAEPLPDVEVSGMASREFGDRFVRLMLKFLLKHGDNHDHRAAMGMLAEIGDPSVMPVSDVDEGDNDDVGPDSGDEPHSDVPRSETPAQAGEETHPRRRRSRAAGKEEA